MAHRIGHEESQEVGRVPSSITVLLSSTWLGVEMEARELRKKIQGAMAHCVQRRLTKRCLYSQDLKYLVQTSDKVLVHMCASVWRNFTVA